MEILLFALFFITSLIFFIAGKDDFGRKEKKLIINETEMVTDNEEIEPKEEVKEEAKLEPNVEEKEETKKEPKDEVKEEAKLESN
tara:strand:+ start:171 stop:425 length:255 start_codon:yes stop_codon:yes gene_type:complete